MLPIYYINLASRPDRRAFMETQLAELGLTGIRVEAVTPADLSDHERALYCNPSKPVYLRSKELACTKSHERAWEMMLAAGDERALVLEDDAELSPLVTTFLQEAASIDIDLIRIEGAGRLRVFPVAHTTKSGVQLRPFRSTPMGASGYIIRTSAVRRLLGHPGMRRRQTDLALYHPFEAPGSLLTRLQTVPGLCRQLGNRVNDQLPIGRSDIASVDEPHVFASEHPLSYRLFKTRRGITHSVRNAADHLANLGKGLTRMRIPFAGEP